MKIVRIKKLSDKKNTNRVPRVFVFDNSGFRQESWTSKFTKNIEQVIKENLGDLYEAKIDVEEYNEAIGTINYTVYYLLSYETYPQIIHELLAYMDSYDSDKSEYIAILNKLFRDIESETDIAVLKEMTDLVEIIIYKVIDKYEENIKELEFEVDNLNKEINLSTNNCKTK